MAEKTPGRTGRGQAAAGRAGVAAIWCVWEDSSRAVDRRDDLALLQLGRRKEAFLFGALGIFSADSHEHGSAYEVLVMLGVYLPLCKAMHMDGPIFAISGALGRHPG